MEIVQVYSLTKADIASCDFAFNVSSEIASPYQDHQHTRPIAPYTKRYSFDEEEFANACNPDSFLAVAKKSGVVCGYILATRSWNGYASIDDIAVDASRRSCGIGSQLVDAAIDWAKSKNLPGVRLQTQNNNVQACRLYARRGFELAGHDRYLYSALGHEHEEVALFWYLIFNQPAGA